MSIEYAQSIVVGAGAAGMMAALKLAEKGTCLVLTKDKTLKNTASFGAQGGIAAVSLPEDNQIAHLEDTLIAGAGLSDSVISALIIGRGLEMIESLKGLGMHFDRNEDGTESLHQEGGHHQRRIWHVQDKTGANLVKTLVQQCEAHQNIQLLTESFLMDLIIETNDQGAKRCVGVIVWDEATKSIKQLFAPAVLLASGGYSDIYPYHTSAFKASGDGIAVAWRAGAAISNMEFIQFHPTVYLMRDSGVYLVTEALRGEGALIRDETGRDFLKDYHPDSELASRDVVSFALENQMRLGHQVFLDVRHLAGDFLNLRFPSFMKILQADSLDPTQEMIPIIPMAHYCCGGIQTDQWGKTTLEGLFAIGECACTGLHGANRLASNSLLECLVMAHQSTDWIQAHPLSAFLSTVASLPEYQAPSLEVQALWLKRQDDLKQLIGRCLGIQRNSSDLEEGFKTLQSWQATWYANRQKVFEGTFIQSVQHLLTCALLSVFSAMKREETRGTHIRQDFPNAKSMAQSSVLSITENGLIH